VREFESAMPPAFSLLKSEFNDFLFAPIGEERNNAELTVLSALARLGIDPWEESAKLAQLSTELATQRLTSIIAGLPNGRWAASDAGTIAARLIGLLPVRRPSAARSPVAEPSQRAGSSRMIVVLSLAFLGSLMFFAIANRERPVSPDSTPSQVTTAPSVPVAGANRP
jgi:hypothetical protein